MKNVWFGTEARKLVCFIYILKHCFSENNLGEWQTAISFELAANSSHFICICMFYVRFIVLYPKRQRLPDFQNISTAYHIVLNHFFPFQLPAVSRPSGKQEVPGSNPGWPVKVFFACYSCCVIKSLDNFSEYFSNEHVNF